ncbi:MAG: hypothetical protein K2G59_04145, partial [Muribaculaceae bacterium]|nr:hypothetical protein [Muribaculaceae bacterium]
MQHRSSSHDNRHRERWAKRLGAKVVSWWEYASVGVWSDRRNTFWIRIMKTLNLSVRSFMRSDLQTLACGLTYRALLAVVPALALLFAIGRGLVCKIFSPRSFSPTFR